MSDKPKRTHEELLQEYNVTCAKLGDCLGKIDDLQKDADLLKSEIRNLKFEAISIQAAPPSAPSPEEVAGASQ